MKLRWADLCVLIAKRSRTGIRHGRATVSMARGPVHRSRPSRRVYLKVIGRDVEACDEGSVSKKPADGESSRRWIWPPSD